MQLVVTFIDFFISKTNVCCDAKGQRLFDYVRSQQLDQLEPLTLPWPAKHHHIANKTLQNRNLKVGCMISFQLWSLHLIVFFLVNCCCFHVFFHSYIFRSSEVHPSTLRHLAKGILRPKAALIVKTFNAKGSSSHQTTWLIQCMKNDLVKHKLPSKVHFGIFRCLLIYNIII